MKKSCCGCRSGARRRGGVGSLGTSGGFARAAFSAQRARISSRSACDGGTTARRLILGCLRLTCELASPFCRITIDEGRATPNGLEDCHGNHPLPPEPPRYDGSGGPFRWRGWGRFPYRNPGASTLPLAGGAAPIVRPIRPQLELKLGELAPADGGDPVHERALAFGRRRGYGSVAHPRVHASPPRAECPPASDRGTSRKRLLGGEHRRPARGRDRGPNIRPPGRGRSRRMAKG